MSDIVDNLMALLFVADAPVPISQLAATLGKTEGQTEQALEVLAKRLDQDGPLQAVCLAGGVQLSTKAEFHPLIAEFLKPDRPKMTRSLLEILAIVAYRQPLTISEIDAIRGVQSDYGVRTLLERNFLREVGRKKTVGRPILYGTTEQFLHSFNLNDLSELPELELQKAQEILQAG